MDSEKQVNQKVKVASELEELRNYKTDGTPVSRYWMEPGDKWWDFSFYFHCFILIGGWMLYNAVTTHYITHAQFILNHTITFVWVVCAGIYSFTAVGIDMVRALKKPTQRTGSQ